MSTFPNERKIEFSSREKMAMKTKRWIEEGVEYIYEATFVFKNLLVMVDVLKVTPTGLEIYELKSSTKVKEIMLDEDLAEFYQVSSND
jgi:predicted anti-sigma-YlaC factor YlaD